jgi:hypothetical protein
MRRNMRKSAKILHLRVSIGANDTRTMDAFREDVLKSLAKSKSKNVTVTGAQHLFEGKLYSLPEWETMNRVAESIEAGEKEIAEGGGVNLDKAMEMRGEPDAS